MKIACFLMLLLCSAFYAKGQELPGHVWKKKVSRAVDMRDEHTGRLPDRHTGSIPMAGANDSSVSEIIIAAIFSRKVTAYKPLERLPVKMTTDEIRDAFYGIVDTQCIDCGLITHLTQQTSKLSSFLIGGCG
jgi:hypothetical protein